MDTVGMIPADAVVVIHFDAQEVRDAALFSEHASVLRQLQGFMTRCRPSGTGFREFKDATDFNPETDLKSITYALTGDYTPEGGDVHAVFGGAQASPGMEGANGKSTVTYEDGKLKIGYSAGAALGVGGGPDDSTLLIAPTPAYADLVKTSTGEAPNVRSSPVLGGLLTSEHLGQIYIAMELPESVKERLRKKPVTAPLAHIQALRLSLHVTDRLMLALALQTDTRESAVTIDVMLKGLARTDDDRTQDDRRLAIALSNLKMWDADTPMYDALNGFLRMGKVILDGESLRPVIVGDDAGDGIDEVGLWAPDREGAAPGSGAEWFFLVSDAGLFDVASRLTGISAGPK